MTLPPSIEHAVYVLAGAFGMFVAQCAGALIERIRGPRRPQTTRVVMPKRVWSPSEIREVDGHSIVHRKRTKIPIVTSADDQLKADVTQAMIQAGFSKAEATSAVERCAPTLRGTLDSWLRAALKETQS